MRLFWLLQSTEPTVTEATYAAVVHVLWVVIIIIKAYTFLSLHEIITSEVAAAQAA